MKLWLKYLIGLVVGIGLAFLVPLMGTKAVESVSFIADIALRFIRFSLLPVLFFGISSSFFKLRDERMMGRTALWTVGVIVCSTAGLVLLGLLSALIVKLPRIPITVEKLSETPGVDLKQLIASLFPVSGFGALVDGAFLLPVFIFAGLAGAGAVSDKVASKQAIGLFDSLSKVFYNVMSFITEIIEVGMIAVSCKWTIELMSALKSGMFGNLIILLAVDTIIVIIAYILILRFLCHDLHPFHVLYAGLCAFFVAFFGGDSNAALPLVMRCGKESLGIRRRINATVPTLLNVFARGGAGMVVSISFVLIMRSYSSLGVGFGDALWIAAVSFLLSFVLGNYPVAGPFAALTMICAMYGRGFEQGYLLLKNAFPIICCFAAGIDVLTNIFGTYIVGVKTKMVIHKEVSQYI